MVLFAFAEYSAQGLYIYSSSSVAFPFPAACIHAKPGVRLGPVEAVHAGSSCPSYRRLYSVCLMKSLC